MRQAAAFFLLCLGGVVAARGAEDWLDGLGEKLTASSAQGGAGIRLSGTWDLENYFLPDPAPGLVYTDEPRLLVPRLAFFLDAQVDDSWYFFAQTRVDQGYDPSEHGHWQIRLDEYVLRFTPPQQRWFSLQAGKFATVVGNWVPRHGSWENPFVTAPLPYENLTGIWDAVAAHSSSILLAWAHETPATRNAGEYADKHERSPIIWGPSYATGFAAMGEIGRFNYAVEVKNASLSSKPDAWNEVDSLWQHPTVSARLGYRPNMMWSFGLSGSSGSYLREIAAPTLLPGFGLGGYRETVFGQDASFAWHYWQVWAEMFEARFEIPRVGTVGTTAGYVEAKYKFTPQFFAAVRWNQQDFGRVADRLGSGVKWGRDAWRLDVAPTYRFTPHLQGKLQYSLLHEVGAAHDLSHTIALQMTVRF